MKNLIHFSITIIFFIILACGVGIKNSESIDSTENLLETPIDTTLDSIPQINRPLSDTSQDSNDTLQK